MATSSWRQLMMKTASRLTATRYQLLWSRLEGHFSSNSLKTLGRMLDCDDMIKVGAMCYCPEAVDISGVYAILKTKRNLLPNLAYVRKTPIFG